MNRKDMILMAVIINAGLLSILFVTAIFYDDRGESNKSSSSAIVEAEKTISEEISPAFIADVPKQEENERISFSDQQSHSDSESSSDVFVNEPSITIHEEDQGVSEPEELPQQKAIIEVTVKKGDVLEKIAKTHGTTVTAIKKANHLENERLQIGQTLKIPLTTKEKESAKKTTPIKETEDSAQFYVIKSGDSPWKIAKQYHTTADEILRLNHLDEESAKNLKIGDRIRVK